MILVLFFRRKKEESLKMEKQWEKHNILEKAVEEESRVRVRVRVFLVDLR